MPPPRAPLLGSRFFGYQTTLVKRDRGLNVSSIALANSELAGCVHRLAERLGPMPDVRHSISAEEPHAGQRARTAA